MGNFEEKKFQGRTCPFRACRLSTPATPLQVLMLHIFRQLRYIYGHNYAATQYLDPNF